MRVFLFNNLNFFNHTASVKIKTDTFLVLHKKLFGKLQYMCAKLATVSKLANVSNKVGFIAVVYFLCF